MGLLSKALNNGDGFRRIERLFQHRGISEQDVKLHEHQFADGDSAGSSGKRGEKRASILVLGAVLIE